MRNNRVLQAIANVPIEPTSNATTQVTNNITIRPDHVQAEYPKAPKIELENPYQKIESRAAQVSNSSDFEKVLLLIFKEILLTGDKALIANIFSHGQIFLTKKQLEELISVKIGKQACIITEDPDVKCCKGKVAPFGEISCIRIVEEDCVRDFKVAFNADYVQLTEEFNISLKLVIF
jgi:hypothetical protein